MNEVAAVDLGSMGYAECFALQKSLLEAVADGNLPDLLLRVEHPSVYTLGANFHEENLPLPKEQYERMGIAVEPTDRGGDITYHGPKQLVVYPIFNLKRYGADLHKWLRDLEETAIRTCEAYGVSAKRFPPNTGVWIDDRKVCAIGIKVRRWASMHGLALNCNNDLAPFEFIVPCGIKGYGVTSLSRAAGREIGVDEAFTAVRHAFEQVFHIRLQDMHSRDLMDRADRLQVDVRCFQATADSSD